MAQIDFTPDAPSVDFTPDTGGVNFTPDQPPKLPPLADLLAAGKTQREQDAANARMTADPGAFTRALAGAPRDIGSGMAAVGKGLYNAAGAGAFALIGDEDLANQQLAGQTNDEGQTPIEEGAASLPPAGRMLAAGTKGLIQSAPQLAAVAGAQAIGVPAPLAAGAIFGSTEHGFDPEQAVIGAILPAVGEASGGIVATLAKKYGLSKDIADDFFYNKAGGIGGAVSLLGADQAAHIAQLPPEQRTQAAYDALANVLPMAMLGAMGKHAPSEQAIADYINGLKSANARPLEESQQLDIHGDVNAPPQAPVAPPVAPPAPEATKPLATVGDAIGGKLDEIKALLTPQPPAPSQATLNTTPPITVGEKQPIDFQPDTTTTGAPNEQIQPVEGQTSQGAGGNVTSGTRGVRGPDETGQASVPSEGGGGAAEVKPPYRPTPTGYPADSPRAMSDVRHTITENQIESAAMTASAWEKPVYIGGMPETPNALSTPPTVTRSKPSYVAATVYPDGRVELERGWYRNPPLNETPSNQLQSPVIPPERDNPQGAGGLPPPVQSPPAEVQRGTPQAAAENAPRSVAPVVFRGVQPGFGTMPAMNLWNLTEDVPGLGVKGSTLAEKTIQSKGFDVPAQKPVVDQTVNKPPSTPTETPKEDVGDTSPPKGAPVETPAAVQAKVQEQVGKVADLRGTAPAKAVKSELVNRLESALEGAPSEGDLFQGLYAMSANTVEHGSKLQQEDRNTAPALTSEIAIRERKGKDTSALREAGLKASGATKVTIDIPGDGTFTVWNTKEALGHVLDRARKLDTSSGKPVAVQRSGTSKADKEWVAAEKAKQPPEPTAPKTGEVHGFGGKVNQKKGGAPSVATTPAQLQAIQTTHTPGLASNVVSGVKSLLLPSSKSPGHLAEAERLGSKLGAMHRRQEASAFQLREASNHFDIAGVHREGLAPGKNIGIKFMSDMSQGRPMSPKLQRYADQIERMFQERITKLAEAGAPLSAVRDNYFPGMWTAESRRAFNAAMEKAKLPQGFDLNSASAAQKAAIKSDVDQFLEGGKGSDKDMLQYLTRRPLAGKESFRKKKVFEDIMTGAEVGLRPISNNPIDLVKGKLAEMDKSIMAHQEFQSLKEAGKLKIISPYEDVPEGWQKINDKYGTIYGAPTVTIPEHIDKAVYEGLLDFAGKLGIKHERSMNMPPGPGNRALGLSYQGQNQVRTKFATETSVLAHEIGHQLDHKYGLWDAITGGEKGNERKSQIQKDLRAIADMTGNRGGQVRSKPEKIAQMVEAYVHAPELMQAKAPTVFQKFDDFIKSKPELAGLADIKPGIELTKLESEKYVGLPIMGYRIVPNEAGDILNNYLSSSLYNNQYFGSLYKGWMAAANLLNQAQLGLGSAFHAGFTTLDAQVSAGADLAKDVYGVARGNRSLADLGKSIARWSVASVRTAATGDKVLDAWRHPDGVMNPKIAAVVKAAELAGGGFKMEKGLETDQLTKMVRDAFSGHVARAALRSPVALTELMAKPIMDYLVPRQKAGVFAELVHRIIQQNPDKTMEELTPDFRAAWNRIDARLGQVRYDRLFINNIAKNVIQGLVRAPGWSGGTIAEIGGAMPDAGEFFKEWAKTGKPPADMPDRVAYALALLATVGAVNALMTYLLTGQKPHGMDYVAFRDGTKDAYGNEKRWLIPSYMKDILAYAIHPGTTLLNKAHPALSAISDVMHNRDYYGYEIHDPRASYPAQAGQVGKYVLKSFVPFWIRGEQQAAQQGTGTAGKAAPLVGVMPAPSYITMSPIQREIAELYHERTGEPIKPYEAQNGPKRNYDKSTMDIYQFSRLPASDKQALLSKMTPAERARY